MTAGSTTSFTRQPLLDAGLPLLHDEPIPFPLGNWRATFVERYRRAAQRLESGGSL